MTKTSGHNDLNNWFKSIGYDDYLALTENSNQYHDDFGLTTLDFNMHNTKKSVLEEFQTKLTYFFKAEAKTETLFEKLKLEKGKEESIANLAEVVENINSKMSVTEPCTNAINNLSTNEIMRLHRSFGGEYSFFPVTSESKWETPRYIFDIFDSPELPGLEDYLLSKVAEDLFGNLSLEEVNFISECLLDYPVPTMVLLVPKLYSLLGPVSFFDLTQYFSNSANHTSLVMYQDYHDQRIGDYIAGIGHLVEFEFENRLNLLSESQHKSSVELEAIVSSLSLDSESLKKYYVFRSLIRDLNTKVGKEETYLKLIEELELDDILRLYNSLRQGRYFLDVFPLTATARTMLEHQFAEELFEKYNLNQINILCEYLQRYPEITTGLIRPSLFAVMGPVLFFEICKF